MRRDEIIMKFAVEYQENFFSESTKQKMGGKRESIFHLLLIQLKNDAKGYEIWGIYISLIS